MRHHCRIIFKRARTACGGTRRDSPCEGSFAATVRGALVQRRAVRWPGRVARENARGTRRLGSVVRTCRGQQRRSGRRRITKSETHWRPESETFTDYRRFFVVFFFCFTRCFFTFRFHLIFFFTFIRAPARPSRPTSDLTAGRLPRARRRNGRFLLRFFFSSVT